MEQNKYDVLKYWSDVCVEFTNARKENGWIIGVDAGCVQLHFKEFAEIVREKNLNCNASFSGNVIHFSTTLDGVRLVSVLILNGENK